MAERTQLGQAKRHLGGCFCGGLCPFNSTRNWTRFEHTHTPLLRREPGACFVSRLRERLLRPGPVRPASLRRKLTQVGLGYAAHPAAVVTRILKVRDALSRKLVE